MARSLIAGELFEQANQFVFKYGLRLVPSSFGLSSVSRYVSIGEVLSDGKWRVIWATPENAENGVYFFRRGAKAWRYVDVWGGVVAPGEKPGVLSWARKLGAPPAIARCFADTAAAEE